MLVSAGLVAWLVLSVDLGELGRQLARARWGWVLLAGALGLAGLWARGKRWRYLFPPDFDPPGIMAGMIIGYMANNVLPLRAGEIVRIYVVARRARRERGLPANEAFWLVTATLVVERVLDSLALVLLLASLVLFVPVPPYLEAAAAFLLALDVVGVTLLVAVAWRPATSRQIVARLTRRWPALARATVGIFDVALRGLEGIRTRAHAVPLLLWTVILWTLPAAAAWSVIRAVGLALPFVAGWTALAFVGLGISVPSAPGYVGVFHAAAALALGVFGAPPAAAVAFGVLYHASQFVPITLAGWAFLLREQLTLGEATRAGDRAPA